MKFRAMFWSAALLLFGGNFQVTAQTLRLLTQAGYLSGVPVLVRVELVDASGSRSLDVWDAEATLSATANVSISTNKVRLRNGLGSALVRFNGTADFELSASWREQKASKLLASLHQLPVSLAGGTLPANRVVWSGIVRITNDVTIPNAGSLTILSNTIVMLDGVASGNSANDIIVNGTLNVLGTEERPVAITCSSAAMRWGQIRHSDSQPSLYRHVSITRGGRGSGEGHTGTCPVIKSTDSKLRFESCNLTDYAEGSPEASNFGTPGKVMMANGSELVFDNCLLSRARMGPEITGTSLLCTNTWIVEMPGPDDSDGFYAHDQNAGDQVLFTHCVVAEGGDDGIDTLGAIVGIENCILRDWASRTEDAKAISVFNGETHVRRSLIVGSTLGIGAKWSSGAPALVTMDHCTLTDNLTNVLANKKSNAPGPFVDFRITNCVMWGGQSIASDFALTNINVGFCTISQAWPGAGNVMSDPLFVDTAARNYRLKPGSPSIDAGAPFAPNDPDGSQTDIGLYTFLPPSPQLGTPQLTQGGLSFVLQAYPSRNYVISFSTNALSWSDLQQIHLTSPTSSILAKPPIPADHAYFKVRLSP